MLRREVGLGLATHGEAHEFRAGDPRTAHITRWRRRLLAWPLVALLLDFGRRKGWARRK
jgi:hypothetical protein